MCNKYKKFIFLFYFLFFVVLCATGQVANAQSCEECKTENESVCQKKCVVVRGNRTQCKADCLEKNCSDLCKVSGCEQCLDLQFTMCAQNCIGKGSPRKVAFCQLQCAMKNCKTQYKKQ